MALRPPGVRVPELFAPRDVNPRYWVIADNVVADHRYLVCGRDDRPAGAPMNGVLTDIVADADAFTRAVDESWGSQPRTLARGVHVHPSHKSACGNAGQRTSSGCSRNQPIVRRSPSSTSTAGSQPGRRSAAR